MLASFLNFHPFLKPSEKSVGGGGVIDPEQCHCMREMIKEMFRWGMGVLAYRTEAREG